MGVLFNDVWKLAQYYLGSTFGVLFDDVSMEVAEHFESLRSRISKCYVAKRVLMFLKFDE